jgi:hypothetical protein
MTLGRIFISLALLLSQAPEQLTESKKADIERLLKLTTAPVLTQMISEIASKDVTESLKVAIPDLPEAAQKAAVEETRAVVTEFANEFLEELYPTYNRLFTHSEIREMLSFYETPLGKKMLNAAAVLDTEGRSLAQKNVKALYPRITARVIERLQKEGVKMR